MNKYQEALKTLFDTALSGVKPQGIDLDYLYYQSFELKQLIDERIEFESRKDKLIVGSEWECVVTQYIDFDGYLSGKGEKYKIIKFSSEHYVIVATLGDVNKTYEILIDQLLYSFKPIEKGE